MKPIAPFLLVVFVNLIGTSAVAMPEQRLAMDFTLPSLAQSGAVRLSDYRGKVVYMDFWASWCTACVISMPELAALRSEFHAEGFELISINVDTLPDAGRAYLKNHPADYPVASDANGTVMKAMAVTALPIGFLIDATGTIRLTHRGYLPGQQDFLKANIQKLLAEQRVLQSDKHP